MPKSVATVTLLGTDSFVLQKPMTLVAVSAIAQSGSGASSVGIRTDQNLKDFSTVFYIPNSAANDLTANIGCRIDFNAFDIIYSVGGVVWNLCFES